MGASASALPNPERLRRIIFLRIHNDVRYTDMLVEEKIEAVAKEIDANFDGILSVEEFRAAAESFGFNKGKEGKIMTSEDEQAAMDKIQEVYSMFDANQDGKVSVGEFCRFVLPDEDLLTKAFIQFDTDRSGSLSRKELKSALKALPRPDDPKLRAGGKALDQLIASFDQDGDDEIDMQEWIAHMSPALKKLLVSQMDENYQIPAFAAKLEKKAANRDALSAELPKEGGRKTLVALGPVGGTSSAGGGGGDLRAKFDELDVTKDGLLDKGELESAMASLLPGVDGSMLKMVLQSEFSKADADLSGSLSFEEFQKFYQTVAPQLKLS